MTERETERVCVHVFSCAWRAFALCEHPPPLSRMKHSRGLQFVRSVGADGRRSECTQHSEGGFYSSQKFTQYTKGPSCSCENDTRSAAQDGFLLKMPLKRPMAATTTTTPKTVGITQSFVKGDDADLSSVDTLLASLTKHPFYHSLRFPCFQCKDALLQFSIPISTVDDLR